MQNQPNLFDDIDSNITDDKVILYALGDFQSRGMTLVDRVLPLERLLGAFRRAFDKYGIDAITDSELALVLGKLGAEVVEVPDFVAKHPYRITVSFQLAEMAKNWFDKENPLD